VNADIQSKCLLLQDLESHLADEESRLDSARDHIELLIEQMSEATNRTDEVLVLGRDHSRIRTYRDLERDLTQLFEESLLVDLSSPSVQLNFIPHVVLSQVGRISVHVAPVGTDAAFDSGSQDSISGSSSDPDTNDSGTISWDCLPSRSRPFRPLKISLMVKFGKRGRSGGEFDLPRDVCYVAGGSHFAVCDTNNERIQVFDEQGLLIRVIGQNEIRPWGLTTSACGEFLVADNADKCVKIFDGDGQLQRKIGSFLCPCGVAVTSTKHVIVTDFFSSCYYVIDWKGDLRRQVRYRTSDDNHACGASRVAVTSRDDVIISDVSNASLKAYDRRGRHLWTVADHMQLVAPHGVCVTDDDIILVGDCVTHRIAQFNVDGQFLGTIRTPEARVREPTSLAISKENTLVVSRMNANQIRVYRVTN